MARVLEGCAGQERTSRTTRSGPSTVTVVDVGWEAAWGRSARSDQEDVEERDRKGRPGVVRGRFFSWWRRDLWPRPPRTAPHRRTCDRAAGAPSNARTLRRAVRARPARWAGGRPRHLSLFGRGRACAGAEAPRSTRLCEAYAAPERALHTLGGTRAVALPSFAGWHRQPHVLGSLGPNLRPGGRRRGLLYPNASTGTGQTRTHTPCTYAALNATVPLGCARRQVDKT